MNTIAKKIYPLTIVKDRYNGIYSGGTYTAWYCNPDRVPKAISGDDVECANFWNSLEYKRIQYQVGCGNNIDEATDNLIENLKKYERIERAKQQLIS